MDRNINVALWNSWEKVDFLGSLHGPFETGKLSLRELKKRSLSSFWVFVLGKSNVPGVRSIFPG